MLIHRYLVDNGTIALDELVTFIRIQRLWWRVYVTEKKQICKIRLEISKEEHFGMICSCIKYVSTFEEVNIDESQIYFLGFVL